MKNTPITTTTHESPPSAEDPVGIVGMSVNDTGSIALVGVSVLVGAAVVAWSLRVNGCMSLAAELTVLSIILCPVRDELRVVEPRAITRDFQ